MRKFLLMLLSLLILLGTAAPAGAHLEASEGELNPDGAAFEINPDDQGWLWISDFDAGQIWGLEIASGFYEVYPVLGAPGDARRVGDDLWWADGQTGILGRVSTIDGVYTRWNVDGVGGFYGTAVDAQGRLWAVDSVEPYLYRLNPDAGELCAFSLPQEGNLDYLLHQAGYLYAGDDVNDRLLRLRISDSTLDWWQLPAGSSVSGLAMDGEGDIWYADSNLNLLAELVLSEDKLNSYPLPQLAEPGMLAVQGGRLWFSDLKGSIGLLNPAAVTPSVDILDSDSIVLEPSCDEIAIDSTGDLTITVDELTMNPDTYPTIVSSGGWQMYQMPVGASPWGIAFESGKVWVVDNGRQVLIQAEGFVDAPELALKKSGAPGTYDEVGDLISYSYQVTNTGSVTLFNITVEDDKTSVTCPNTAAGLAPQGKITCTATYTITGDDVGEGASVTNRAYATDGITQSEEETFTVYYSLVGEQFLFLPLVIR